MSAQAAAVPQPLGGEAQESETALRPSPKPAFAAVAVFALAMLARLLYLFFFVDPQNAGDGMTDTYHHWQIGFLTWQVGLSHGFRLWDLKGLEYFWGLLHPAMLVILFAVTRSIDIIIPRLVSSTFGSLGVALLFLLCRRYWGNHVAFSVGAFAALAPPLIFSDALGMVEPVAVAFVLLGIYWAAERGFLAGVAWGLAAMARAEAWAFTFGLLLAGWLRRQSLERFLPLAIGWLLVMGLYMKVLFDHTGNPIYPIYWEFLVEVTGRWLGPVVSSEAHAVQPFFVVLVLLSGLGLLVSLWKRPASYLLLCYGFGSTAFVLGLLAFTPFLSTWSTWVWRLRVLAFPLDFAFILAALLLFVGLRRFFAAGWMIGGWSLTVLVLISVQLTWWPIQQAYWLTEPTWEGDLAAGREIAAIYRQASNRWGHLNIPADQPTLTYTLARFGGVRGDQLIGQLYDPFYSLPAGYRYDQHPAAISKAMACWLRDTKTSIFVVPDSNRNYQQFVADHSTWFRQLARIPDRGWTILGIPSAAAIASACRN